MIEAFLVLTGFLIVLVRFPFVAAGLAMTLADIGDLEIFGSKVRVYWTVLLAVRFLILVATCKATRTRIVDRAFHNTFVQATVVMVPFLVLAWPNLTAEDITTGKTVFLWAGLPLLAIVVAARDERDVRSAVVGTMLGVFIQGGFELWRFLILRPDSNEMLRLGIVTRATSRMLISGWQAMAFVGALYFAGLAKSRWIKIAVLAIGSFAGLVLLLSGTRSSLLAAVVAGLYLLCVNRRRLILAIIPVVAVVIIALTVCSFGSGEWPLVQRLQDLVQDPAGESQPRTALYGKALYEDFPAHPILGTGLFLSGEMVPVVNWDRNWGATTTGVYYRVNYENLYLTLLVETGLVGLTCLVLLFTKLWFDTSRRFLTVDPEPQVWGKWRLLLRAWMLGAVVRAFFYGAILGAFDLFLAIALLSLLQTIRAGRVARYAMNPNWATAS